MSPNALVVITNLKLPTRNFRSALRRPAVWGLLAGLVVAPLLRAETTKQWRQSLFEDFEEGRAEKLSLRSDGALLLAPSFREIYDAPSSYLWALAADSKGNLYAAGGPDAKLFRIGPDGAGSTLFETAAVEIHALAVDANDNVYAATSPEAKIYKIEPSGGHSLFFDPGENYIWDMAFDSKGNLLVATGDKGKIYRVTPDGQGTLFFDTGETHVRSITVDASDNVIVGTDPSGLILRISAKQGGAASGFVLHQTSKKEVTAVILAPDGSIYAAGVGTRLAVTAPTQATSTGSADQPPSATVTNLIPGAPQEAPGQGQAQQQIPSPSGLATRVTGGSDIYRIAPDGEPSVVWHSRDDIVYALGFDKQGRLLMGTGDQGRLIRLDSEHVYSIVLKTASRQITALASGPKGQVYTATSNIGKIFELGPGLETEGSFESKPFDAGIFSRWGRLEFNGTTSGQAKIAVSTRSGNLDSPARNWSDWSAAVTSAEGGEAASPAARFVQWRAMLSGPAGAESPSLDSVTLYYRPKNIAPVVSEIEATPPNYRFADKPQTPPVKNLTLAPLGAGSRRSGGSTAKPGHTLLPAQGYVGARWDADDDNDDTLVYKVEIRAEDETTWKLLKDEVEDSYLSWDSTAFADGLYRVRVTASDAPSNPVSETKTHSRISEPFRIDNTAPRITDLSGTLAQGKLRVRFSAHDTATAIQSAEYSLDGGDWERTLPTTTLYDSQDLSFDFAVDAAEAGEHTVAVRVDDSHDNVATAKAVVR
jgi:hypothetical protein